MKVVCIDNEFTEMTLAPPVNVVIGNVYNVHNTIVNGDNTFYELKEFLDPVYEWLWDAEAFIPLSSIDETEMERNYKTEKV